MSRMDDGLAVLFESPGAPGKVLGRADLDQSVAGCYDEKWLQQQLHLYPEMFPVERIEPGFGKLISICRELPLQLGGGKSGSLDNLLMTSDGRLVLVEAKLWRNPQARREVVAQALDYAAAVFQMDYTELEAAVLKARGLKEQKLAEIVSAAAGGVDETEFHDSLTRNLECGRAIIAVVGDGIREDVRSLASLVQSHAGHRFTFALVEMAVFENPDNGLRVVVPSVLAQTKLIERGVVRIETDSKAGMRVVVEPASTDPKPSTTRRMSITEDEFFDALGQRNPVWPNQLKQFLEKAESLGVYADFRGGLNLRRTLPDVKPLNMGNITKEGIVDTGMSTWWDRKAQGAKYNSRIAQLIGGSVKMHETGSGWVKTASNKLPLLSDLLPQYEQGWLDAIELYIQSFTGSSAE